MENNLNSDGVIFGVNQAGYTGYTGYGNLINEPAQVTQPVSVETVTPYQETLKVTSFDDLQRYSRGSVVRFPDFAEGEPFIARVRRPSMLSLAKSGQIPNELLAQAASLFTGGNKAMEEVDSNTLANMYEICEIVCKAALISPTYDEILQAGLTLNDEQIMAIFNYTQVGVQALKNFRE